MVRDQRYCDGLIDGGALDKLQVHLVAHGFVTARNY